ncbi:MAG: hypothetical protein AAFQ66_08335 [Pseudomonadota bacterium]
MALISGRVTVLKFRTKGELSGSAATSRSRKGPGVAAGPNAFEAALPRQKGRELYRSGLRHGGCGI